MAMNHIIQEKRKALGLTQEQIAEYLGVSAPAVNKWEKGVTCPDISLLAPLARLLKTDLNTLLCFHESLTPQEMGRYQAEISKAIERNGIEAGFRMAREFRRKYPNCDQFLYYNTMLLEGAIIMSEMTQKEKEPYINEILIWYEYAAQSEIEEVRNNAIFAAANKYLNQNQIEKAQEMADLLPDHYSPNKKILQANIYLRQERPDDAALLAAQRTFSAVMELQAALLKLLETEAAAGKYETAEQIAEISRQTAEVLGLWEYNRYIGSMEAALSRKDISESIRLMSTLLDVSEVPWHTENSPLFHRIPMQTPERTLYIKIASVLRSDLETNPRYDFMWDSPEFRKLLDRASSKKAQAE